MGAPETGEETALTGTWATIQPGLPPQIADIANSINTFANFLVGVLNVALTILNIVKAFMVGFLDPIVPIIEAVISEVEGFLNDIRQMGIYIAGDLRLEYPFDEILGGYQGYERRMIKRLVDRNDPTRPDFTSRTAVIAIFLYTSADASRIYQVIELIKRLREFFGDNSDDKLNSVPVGLKAQYGMDGASLYSFGALQEALSADTVPDSVNLTWEMAVPPATGLVQWPLPAPQGFLIEVSTVKDGFLMGAEVPSARASMDAEGQQDRTQGLVTYPSGKVLRLYGGQDRMNFSDLLGETGTVSGNSFDIYPPMLDVFGKLNPGMGRVLLFRNNADTNPLYPDALKTTDAEGNDVYVFQRTFYVDSSRVGTVLAGPGQPFSTTLKHSDMPWDAEVTLAAGGGSTVTLIGDEPASKVYVRVTAVNGEVAEYAAERGENEVDVCKWDISSSILNTMGSRNDWQVFNALGRPLDAVGVPSDALEVTFPSASTQECLDTVTAALAVMLLVRADLKTAGTSALFQRGVGLDATGLEPMAETLVPWMLGQHPGQFFRKGMLPTTARQQILTFCRVMANDLYHRMGPSKSLESYIAEQGEVLRSFKWSDLGGDWANTNSPLDMTIIESLESQDSTRGVALSPDDIGLTPETLLWMKNHGVINPARDPGFLVNSRFVFDFFMMDVGSEDWSPVLYNQELWKDDDRTDADLPVEFIRCSLLDSSLVLASAMSVLQVAASPLTLTRDPSSGSWTALRMFPQGLPAVDLFMEDILRWVKSIQAGMEAITEMIKAYIESMEARVLEIQAAIVRINALLQSLLQFTMPSANGLVVTSYGTDGVLQELVTAENKPSDSTTAYGAGMVILAGGLPATLIELLQMFFPTEES